MLIHLPDMKRVENLHKHMRDTQQSTGRQVVSNVARMRSCIDSGVLEESGIAHIKPTKTMSFKEWHRRQKVTTAWRFNSKRMKMTKRMDKHHAEENMGQPHT